MRKDFKASRISPIEREIYLSKIKYDEPDFKDILAAIDQVVEKLGISAVQQILGKCGAKTQDELPKKEYARFLRLAKDYLSSV